MDSFYGGQSGKSFEIKKIFTSKKEMLADLNLRWQSPVGVSDYVVISYGLPGVEEEGNFTDNQQQDLDTFGQSYNSTLWQKIYTEKKIEGTDPLTGVEILYIADNQGLGYRLITSMSGNTPQFSVYTKILHSYENPRWFINNASIDKPKLTICLPMAQIVSFKKKTGLIASSNPYFEWDITTNGSTYNQYDSNGNAIPDGKDRPILVIGIPPSWKWKLDYGTLSANQNPTFTLTDDGTTKTMTVRLPKPWGWNLTQAVLDADEDPIAQLTNNGNIQTLKLSLPQSQILHTNDTVVLNADEDPVVIFDDTNINDPELTFKLPQSQILHTNDTIVLNADEDPVVIFDDTTNINAPQLTFKLPQSQVLHTKDTVVLDADEDPVVIFDDTTDINAPSLTFKLPQSQVFQQAVIHVLKANENPSVNVNYDNINEPVIHFYLPVSQQLQQGETIVLNADKDPLFEIDNTDPNKPVLKVSLPQSQVFQPAVVHVLAANEQPRVEINYDNINEPIIHFYLPASQQLQEGTTTVLDADEDPRFEINADDPNNPVLNFFLPQSQILSMGTNEVLDADQDPVVMFNNSDINNTVISFKLPQAQVMDDPETNVVAPVDNPSVSLSGTVNSPKLVFNLPRATKFYYGGLLGKRTQVNYTLSVAEVQNYEIGDYYINTDTGFIYSVTQKQDNNVTFTYVACLQAPIPRVNSIAVNPYSEDGTEKINPSVFSSFDNNDEKTGWVLNFNLPKLPTFSVTHEFLGSAGVGDVTLTTNAEDNANFHFKLPSASRIFAGTVVKEEGAFEVSDFILGNALPGDLYLNTKDGIIYKLDTDKIWRYQNEGLKGPTGDALNIVRSYRITVSDTMPNSLDNGVQYIIDNYIDDSGSPLPYSPDEIFAIVWIDGAEETSYWYFYTEDEKWSRVRLGGTGGISEDSIQNSYVETTDENLVVDKIYGINYINKLIGGSASQNSNITTFSKDQIYALFSWGTFEEAKNGSWWPGPENIQ